MMLLFSLGKIVAVIAALLGFLLTTSALGTRLRLHSEIKRKILHAGLGLSTLFFPLIFSQAWEIGLLSALIIAIMMIIRTRPALRCQAGSSLYGVERSSFGEVFFVIAVLVLFLVSGRHTVLYVVPLIVLTLSDAAAALVGLRFGKRSFPVMEGQKSLEGMAAFFGVSLVSIVVGLACLCHMPVAALLLTAFIIAALGTLIEAVSWRGYDNLLIPLGCYLVLQHDLQLGVMALAVSAATLVALTGLALFSHRVSTLKTHALLAAMITAWLLGEVGGPQWFMVAVVVFAIHAAAGCLYRDTKSQSLDAVLCVGGTSLFWLNLSVMTGYRDAFFLYCLSMAIHTQIIVLLRAMAFFKRRNVRRRWVAMAAMGAGAAIYSIFLMFEGVTPQHLVRVAVAVLCTFGVGTLTGVKSDRASRGRWIEQGAFALFGSMAGFVVMEGLGL